MDYKFQFYQHSSELPKVWNSVVASENILLSQEYFHVLETSKPPNMECYFGCFFLGEELIGGCLFQYLDFQKHSTLQRPNFICRTRNLVSKILVKNVLILGNNMLTGHNAFHFNEDKISPKQSAILLENAIVEMQDKFRNSSLTIIKDFTRKEILNFKQKNFQSYFQFSVQPNMILNLKNDWLNFEDYTGDFSKKYRARANSARKKLSKITKQELSLKDIITNASTLNSLYYTVAENATINTFFLPINHFEKLKENLGENFRIFGYFLDKKLIGFFTLILNGENIDTYFLGYDKDLQKEKQLYLNMLFDMVEFGIHQKFKTIIFGRTALEIKSTIGAEPLEIFGLIRHNRSLINRFTSNIFPYLEPKTDWIQRKPFKNKT